MAVGEEHKPILPTGMPRPGGARSQRSADLVKRTGIAVLMCFMAVALVGTLSHVSAGARYFGMQAAQEKAAATQQARNIS